jgi:hypothetical protein
MTDAAVRELQDRQAVYDCIMRYCRGIDRLDREVMLSAYHDDAIDDHGDYVGRVEGFVDWAISFHETHQRETLHHITNHSCELAGDTAHAESYYFTRCVNRQPPWFNLISGRYIDRLERRDGRWGIVARICMVDIFDENSAPEGTAREGVYVPARRDRSDPAYQRPLTIDPTRINTR